MKKLSILILLTFGLLLLFSGCKNEQLDIEQNVQPYYLLTENTCSFPCWMGITPGETSYPELKEIIDQLVQDYAEKGVAITYIEQASPVKHIDRIRYIYAEMPGSEAYIILDSINIVKEIKIIFLNTPTVAEFAENYKAPDNIGICMAHRYAHTNLVYDGARVLTKKELPNYDAETGLISIEDFYLNRVDEVQLRAVPQNKHYDFTFDWEDMAQTVFIDINNTDPNSDCLGRFQP